MIRRPPRSTQSRSSAASDVYKRQVLTQASLRAEEPYADALGTCPANKRPAQVLMCVAGRLPRWIGTQRTTNTTAELMASMDALTMVPMTVRHQIATDSLLCYDLLANVSTATGRRDVRRRTRMPWRSQAQRAVTYFLDCLLYTSPSPRDQRGSRMPSSA